MWSSRRFTEASAGSVFPSVHEGRRTHLQHARRIAEPATIATHVHDLLCDRRSTSFVEEIQLKALMGAPGVLALRVLFPALILPPLMTWSL